MKAFLIIFTCCLIGYLVISGIQTSGQPVAVIWKLPLNTADRQDLSTAFLESDAHFKALRAPFGPVKLHYHTGIDLQNGNTETAPEPVYAIAAGKVVAIEDSPPQRRITIEHTLPDGKKVWSIYIHIIDEQVKVGDIVDTETVIARLMTLTELQMYGLEYNHVHLEIMKQMPIYATDFQQRKTFTCYTEREVDEYFFNPEEFLRNQFTK